MNVMIVPTRPSKTMVRKLAKNFFRYILKPLANTIGGRQMKKNKSSLNFINSVNS